MKKLIQMNLQLFAENKPKTWELKQSVTDPSTLELYIYGIIEGDGYDYWEGRVVESETSSNHFKNELAKNPDIKNITVFVNSNGGYVLEAMAIRNQLKRHPATVTGYVDGFACSAASFLLTGCDIVKMYSNTMQMLHDASDGCWGNARDMRKCADDLDAIMVGNRQAYLEKSNGKLTEEKLIEILEAESWLTAEQCFEYGLCDEIIKEEADLTEAKQMLQKANLTVTQQIEINRSLKAQLKILNEPVICPKQAIEPKPTPEPDPIPEPVQENKLLKFLSTI